MAITAAGTVRSSFANGAGQPSRASFRTAAVLGSGPLGVGIAAHCANAGMRVKLLDLKAEDANKAVERLRRGSTTAGLSQNPLNAGFYLPSFAERIETGSSLTDMAMIADADFIQEAVTEKLPVKILVVSDIIRHCKQGAYICTNTSSIPLKQILDGLPEDVREEARRKKLTFAVFHWFNPPRMLRLVEIVPAEGSSPKKIENLCAFARDTLGKSPQVCKDNPGFLANLVGTYALKQILNFAIDNAMRPEDVDAVLNVNAGFGNMGPTSVLDLVGLDIARSVVQSLLAKLPLYEASPEHAEEMRRAAQMFVDAGADLPLLDAMIEQGRLGRKTEDGAGFNRMAEVKDDSGATIEKKRQVADFVTGEYRDRESSKLDSARAGRTSLRAVLETDDIGGRLAWHVLKNLSVYASLVTPEVSTGIDQMDTAMRDGYDWKRGPFENIDALGDDLQTGPDYLIGRLEREGVEIPPFLRMAAGRSFYRTENNVKQALGFDGEYHDLPKKPGVLDLQDIKNTSEPIEGRQNDYASLWDIGDGVICVELHGPGNSLMTDTMDILNAAMDIIERGDGRYNAMVIYAEDKFGVGANLALVSIMANTATDDSLQAIDDALYTGQMTLDRMQKSKIPVVGAPKGLAFGGACEVLLHCDQIVADPELHAGQVEVGVAVVPAWGGCKELLRRHIAHAALSDDIDSPELRAFTAAATPLVSSSAHDAQRNRILNPDDIIVMNRDNLLARAKQAALDMVPGYKPPEPVTFRLGGERRRTLLDAGVDGFDREGRATWGDVTVLYLLAEVMSGGDTYEGIALTEYDILALERRAFMTAVTTDGTAVARMRHILVTGKPLREEPLDEEDGVTTDDLRAQIDYYDTKPRLPGNPFLKTAVQETAMPAKVGPDLRSMSRDELFRYLVQLVREDEWRPQPPQVSLTDTYNDVADDTNAYLAKTLPSLRTLALGKDNKAVLEMVEGILRKKVGIAQEKIAANDGDPDKRRAQIAMYNHHTDMIADLRRGLG